MAKQTSETRRKLKGVKGYRGRSDAYEYIRDNLDRLIEQGFGTPDGPSWQALANHLTRKGKTNNAGGQLSRGSAYQIFGRAKRDAEVAARAVSNAVPIHKPQPSQVLANWASAPASVPATQIIPTPLTAGFQAQPSASDHVRPGESRPRTGEEKVAAIRRKLAERSGL